MKSSLKNYIILLLTAGMGYLCMFNSSGSYSFNGGRTGASFDNGTCATGSGCHNSSGSFNPTTTLTLLDGSTSVTSYVANKSYTLQIKITSSGTNSSTRYGFQGVCVQSSSNNNINNWGSMPSNTKTVTINSRTYVSHSTRLTNNTISIPWTAPATSTGNVTFYASGLVANGNNQNTGDNVATASLTVSPASSGGCTAPSISPQLTHVDCYDGSTGAINITTSGGTSPFSYDWTGPNSYSASSKNISGLKAGNYRLIVTANGGCKDTAYASITQPSAAITSNVNSNSPACIGDNITLSSSAAGGNTGSYSYTWKAPGGGTTISSSLLVPNATIADAGDYLLTIKDAKNCTLIDTVNVQVDSMPQLDGISVDMLTSNTFKFNMYNPRYVESKIWMYGDGATDTLTSPIHTYTTYSSYTAMLIISNHCGSDTFSQIINVWPDNVETVKAENEISIYPNPAVKTLHLDIKSDMAIRSYSLISMHGAVVYKEQQAMAKNSIDISGYANGVYFLQLQKSDGTNKVVPITIKH